MRTKSDKIEASTREEETSTQELTKRLVKGPPAKQFSQSDSEVSIRNFWK